MGVVFALVAVCLDIRGCRISCNLRVAKRLRIS